MKMLNWISDNLLPCVLLVGGTALFLPEFGTALTFMISPVLALMVLWISMTIAKEDLIQIRRQPGMMLWGALLQLFPMAAFSLVLGHWLPTTDLATGQLLVGGLPADISAPLMVYLAGGSTALATAMLVVAMVLTPFVLPWILGLFGQVAVEVPTSYLVIELSCIIIIPVILGVILNTYSPKVRLHQSLWSGLASLCYLVLLFVVVSTNAKAILALGSVALLLIGLEISLNLFGYGLAYLTYKVGKNHETFIPLLFLTGSKEFGIASAVVDSMKLAPAVAIPSTFYAVVQMISLPLVVKIILSWKKSLSAMAN
jgi:BASS family bile acid:Na+ symporter